MIQDKYKSNSVQCFTTIKRIGHKKFRVYVQYTTIVWTFLVRLSQPPRAIQFGLGYPIMTSSIKLTRQEIVIQTLYYRMQTFDLTPTSSFDLNECNSVCMSDEDDFLPIIDSVSLTNNDVDSWLQGNLDGYESQDDSCMNLDEHSIGGLKNCDEAFTDKRQELARGNSIKSLDAEWIDDDLFVNAVSDVSDIFDGDEDHFSTPAIDPVTSHHMGSVKYSSSHVPTEISTVPMNSDLFQEYWNSKMAQLAQSMKRSEATRTEVIRQREVLMAQQKRLQQYQQSRYSTSSSVMGFPSSFAHQGRRLNGFMASMRPNML